MPKHRNFEAWICCGDQKLQEFGCQVSSLDDMVYTCWIESEVGKTFSVHWKHVREDMESKGKVHVDGIHVVSVRGSCKGGSSWGVQTEMYMMRPYKFANINLTDDESVVNRHINTKDIGEIRLEVLEAKAKYPISPQNPHVREPPVGLCDGSIHESTKKSCNHRVSLGEPVFRPLRPNGSSYRVEYHKESVTFVFKYRSRAFLRAEGIIWDHTYTEHSCEDPSSSRKKRKQWSSGDDKKDCIDLTTQRTVVVGSRPEPEEAEESLETLQRQFRELQDKITRKTKRVKVEPKAEPTVLRLGDNGVIDLTLD